MIVSFVRSLSELEQKNGTFVDHVNLLLGDDVLPIWLSTSEWSTLREYANTCKDVPSKWIRFNIDLADAKTAKLFSLEILGWVDP